MRYNDMNNFLLMVSKFIKENPNLTQKERDNLIYKLLIRTNTSNEDVQRDFSNDGTFNRLIYYFKDKNNINAFVNPRYSYFCQFTNPKGLFNKTSEAIKIYVPQDGKHLEQSAKLIFDYLDKHNYCHVSKIARRVRFDNIVIRMKDKNEAKDLLNYIKNNKYINEGLIKPNPFTYSYNNIALACDRNMSYNSTVSSLINLYMKNIEERNAFDKVSIEDYINFVSIYYKFHFIKYNDIKETVTDFDIDGAHYNDTVSNEKIVNVRDIIDLHLKSMDPSYTLEKYFADYEERLDINIVKEKAHKLKEERAKGILTISEDIDEIDMLLFNSIELLKEKYKDRKPNYPFDVIQKYVNTFDQKFITRDYNLRQTFVEKDFGKKLKEKLNLTGNNVITYYYSKLDQFNTHILNNAIYETYKKYQDEYERHKTDIDGFTWVREALLDYIERGRPKGFTRENNVRQDLINYLNPLTVSSIIDKSSQRNTSKEELYNIVEEYISNVIMNRYSLNQKKKTV